MQKKFRSRRTRRNSQSGQGLVEYVLLLSLIVSMSLILMKQFNNVFRSGFLTLNAELEKSLVSGNIDRQGTNLHVNYWFN